MSSPSRRASADIVMFTLTVCPGCTVTSCIASPYPICWTRRTWLPAGTPVTMKRPDAFVIPPVSAMVTVAPATGAMLDASVTRPVTVPVSCALNGGTSKNAPTSAVAIERGSGMLSSSTKR